jgi:hypothetical protein
LLKSLAKLDAKFGFEQAGVTGIFFIHFICYSTIISKFSWILCQPSIAAWEYSIIIRGIYHYNTIIIQFILNLLLLHRR